MNLFITNKKEFEEAFDNERLLNTTRNGLTSKEIHKKAYEFLYSNVNVKHVIPLAIFTDYDGGEGVVVFIFKNKKDDVYFYEFSGTAS
jgi:hypothetical protein